MRVKTALLGRVQTGRQGSRRQKQGAGTQSQRSVENHQRLSTRSQENSLIAHTLTCQEATIGMTTLPRVCFIFISCNRAKCHARYTDSWFFYTPLYFWLLETLRHCHWPDLDRGSERPESDPHIREPHFSLKQQVIAENEGSLMTGPTSS